MTPEKECRFSKVRREGGSLTISLGKFIPGDWTLVKMIKEDCRDKPGKEWVRLRLEKVA